MPHVDLQVTGLHETLFTVWALERFVFSVVVPKDKKAFPQQRNGLFFLLCVRVYGGSGWPSTWTTCHTRCIWKFSCVVAGRMWTKRVLHITVFPTVCTKAWFLFEMSPLALRQSPRVQKHLPTVHAMVGYGLSSEWMSIMRWWAKRAHRYVKPLPDTEEWSLRLMRQMCHL